MIDTAEKRLSMLDFGLETQVALPFPTGTIDAGERLHLLWLYSGFGSGPPPPVTQPPWAGFIGNTGRMMVRRG